MADLNSNLSVSPIVAGAKCSTASTSIGMALPKPNARDAAMRRKIRLQKLKLLRERNSARNIELEEDETKPSVHDAMNLDGPSSKKQQRYSWYYYYYYNIFILYHWHRSTTYNYICMSCCDQFSLLCTGNNGNIPIMRNKSYM